MLRYLHYFFLFLPLLSAARETINSTQAKQFGQKNSLSFIENKGQVLDQYGKSRNDIDFKIPASNAVDLIILSPNPVKNLLNIRMHNHSTQTEITISDMYGRIMITKEIDGNGNTTIATQILLPGTYFARITDNGRLLKTAKIVKE